MRLRYGVCTIVLMFLVLMLTRNMNRVHNVVNDQIRAVGLNGTNRYRFKDTHANFLHTSEIKINEKEAKDDTEVDIRSEQPGGSIADIQRRQNSSAIQYHGRDFMQDQPIVFDKHFKNPCWWKDQWLYCLPYVFLIGVKKCGTGELFRRLSTHPDFQKPGFKEAQFFARKRFREGYVDNISTYVHMFDKASNAILARAKPGADGRLSNNETITGEGSPSNLHLNSHWRQLPGNEDSDEPRFLIIDYIHHFIPDAKILITFRDPVERLYSDYYHEYGNQGGISDPNPNHFHSVVKRGLKMYRDCFKIRTVRSCVYDPTFYDETKIQIELGIYYIYWLDLIRVFRRDQILILQNKDFRNEEATTKIIYEFIGLRPLRSTELLASTQTKNSRRAVYVAKGPMFNETFRLLQEFYEPFNRKMADITENNDFLYGAAKDE